MPTDGERRTRNRTRLKRGDKILYRGLLIECVGGRSSVVVEAPLSEKYAIVPRKKPKEPRS